MPDGCPRSSSVIREPTRPSLLNSVIPSDVEGPCVPHRCHPDWSIALAPINIGGGLSQAHMQVPAVPIAIDEANRNAPVGMTDFGLRQRHTSETFASTP